MSETTVAPVQLSLASSYESIELAQYVCDYILRHRTLPADTVHALSMTLREAVANAIKHGNRGDASKRVFVTMELTDDSFRMSIEDQGKGFDLSLISDPLAPENRLKTSGRGIFYMKNFMDDVRYDFTPGGTRVVLVKNIGGVKK